MSEIPDDIWKAADAAAKLIIIAEELEVNSCRVYDAAMVIANAIIAERQRCAALVPVESGMMAEAIHSAILAPAEKETE
jgi:non-homologous end joining protein Ku